MMSGFVFSVALAAAAATPCDQLKSLPVHNMTITAAELIPAGPYTDAPTQRGGGRGQAQAPQILRRMLARFLAVPHVTRAERLRFLRAYLRAGERQADWKSWWRLVSEATAVKVAKNRRSGRALG